MFKDHKLCEHNNEEHIFSFVYNKKLWLMCWDCAYGFYSRNIKEFIEDVKADKIRKVF